MVTHVKSILSRARNHEDEHENMHSNMFKMVKKASLGSLEVPRLCGRRTQLCNVLATTPKDYFRKAIFILYLDSLLPQFNIRFGYLAHSLSGFFTPAVQYTFWVSCPNMPSKHFHLISRNCVSLDQGATDETFHQEVNI